MLVELPVRGVRVGGVTVGPGEARAVAIPLVSRRRGAEGGSAAARTIPAWVVVGTKAGPRVSVVGAVRGFETSAARAATRLAAEHRTPQSDRSPTHLPSAHRTTSHGDAPNPFRARRPRGVS